MNRFGRKLEKATTNELEGLKLNVVVLLLILLVGSLFWAHVKKTANQVTLEVLARSSAGDLAVALKKAIEDGLELTTVSQNHSSSTSLLRELGERRVLPINPQSLAGPEQDPAQTWAELGEDNNWWWVVVWPENPEIETKRVVFLATNFRGGMEAVIADPTVLEGMDAKGVFGFVIFSDGSYGAIGSELDPFKGIHPEMLLRP